MQEPFKDEADKFIYWMPKTIKESFKEFFTILDSNLDKYNIKNYLVRNMNLEEVFLEIRQIEKKSEDKED